MYKCYFNGCNASFNDHTSLTITNHIFSAHGNARGWLLALLVAVLLLLTAVAPAKAVSWCPECKEAAAMYAANDGNFGK